MGYQRRSSGGGGDVSSVAGRTGVVVLAKEDVGLDQVDNTSDAAKPVSDATATALGAKLDASLPPITAPGTTGAGASPGYYYGSDGNAFLGGPPDWFSITVNGVPRKVPVY